jgi:hypothetical protein
VFVSENTSPGGIMKSGKRKKRISKGKRQKMKEKLKPKGKKMQKGQN